MSISSNDTGGVYAGYAGYEMLLNQLEAVAACQSSSSLPLAYQQDLGVTSLAEPDPLLPFTRYVGSLAPVLVFSIRVEFYKFFHTNF